MREDAPRADAVHTDADAAVRWLAAALVSALLVAGRAHAAEPAPTTGRLVVAVSLVGGALPTHGQVSLSSPVDLRPFLAEVDPADGTARFDHLLPGAYTVVTSGEGYVSARTEAYIQAGRITTVRVGLYTEPDPPRPRRRCLFWRRGV